LVLLPDGQKPPDRLPGRITRCIEFLATNALALASLTIAITALTLTIITNNRDAYYRELLIQPLLTFNVTPNFEVRLENRGLGPALIRAASLTFNDKCYDLSKPLPPERFDELIEALGRHFFLTVFNPLSLKLPSSYLHDAQFTLVTPGIQLTPGEHTDVFSLSPGQFELIEKAFVASDKSVRRQVMHRYLGAALTYPISIEYCSVSRKYCDHLGAKPPCRAK
jgi:hypothetical protein